LVSDGFLATFRLAIAHVLCLGITTMKPMLLPALLLTTICLSPLARADDSPLAKQMESLNDAYKAFRNTEDPSQGAALARDAQSAVAQGLSELPTLLIKMPDGPARAKAAASYRHAMGLLYVKLCEVEQAFLEQQTDRIEGLIEEIKELKKKGHNEFMEDE
jgi:hypothetical protein